VSIHRMKGEPSPIMALGGLGAVIGAALGAILIGGVSGFAGIVISAFIGALAGMTLGRAIR
jgi:hypothetical protein